LLQQQRLTPTECRKHLPFTMVILETSPKNKTATHEIKTLLVKWRYGKKKNSSDVIKIKKVCVVVLL
jgi:hypothetical protein